MTPPCAILVVDDDDRYRERFARALRTRGYEVGEARAADEALAVVATKRFDRAVLDLRMPAGHGLVLLRRLKELYPELEVVIVTGYGSIATAIEAIRLGARDYLTKPMDVDRVLAAFEADPADLPLGDAPSLDEAPSAMEIPSLARVEFEHIERVLTECSGNISRAARVLGIHRRTLQLKLAKYPVSR